MRARRVLGAILVALLLLPPIAGGAAAWWGWRTYHQPGPLSADRAVVVPHGGLDQVAGRLQAEGVIDHPGLFKVAAVLTRPRGPLHAAELLFPAHATMEQVLAVLRTARPVQHHLTIPEGLTAAQIAELIGNAPSLTGDTPALMEGGILPETYLYEHGATRAALVARARKAMDKALDHVWANRAPGLPLASPRAALILASIVERETAKPAERPRIAAVFLNRLRLGMKLQSDPTVIYGVSHGLGGLDRKLTRADLETETPYNTYRIAGLPPGPIDSPGLASLRAVTRPAATGDLYFVADGTGGHAFAANLPDHLHNVARYRALEADHVPMPASMTPALPMPESKSGHHGG